MQQRDIDSQSNVLGALDELLQDRGGRWWDSFYLDRARPCPFFVERPDENLARWVAEGAVTPGCALELGCGNGRNSIYLAEQGWEVTAVDFSKSAIAWARENASRAGVTVEYRCESVYDLAVEPASVDLVYECGCFHHVPPHRRPQYVRLVTHALRPGGTYGLVCFRPEGGSGLTDDEVYERRSMGGGLGFSPDRLRVIWGEELDIVELEPMRQQDARSGTFGEAYLWAMRALRRPDNEAPPGWRA